MSTMEAQERATPTPLVLVVEDYEDARELFAELLSTSGFAVAEATNGHDAVRLALELVPDVVIMDLAMPEVDGWEATRRLKADARTRHIPVVALTGHVLESHVRAAEAAGCAAFLSKPCLPDVLMATIEEILGRAER